MAAITISMHFADGDVVCVCAKGKNPSPDAFQTMCRQAFDGWSDAVAYAIAIQGVETDG